MTPEVFELRSPLVLLVGAGVVPEVESILVTRARTSPVKVAEGTMLAPKALCETQVYLVLVVDPCSFLER